MSKSDSMAKYDSSTIIIILLAFSLDTLGLHLNCRYKQSLDFLPYTLHHKLLG